MKNLINEIKSISEKEIKSFGITEVAAMINTRHSHKVMHGTTLENTQLFLLPDGSKMEFPRDSKYGASASEIINCQCMVVYGAKRSY